MVVKVSHLLQLETPDTLININKFVIVVIKWEISIPFSAQQANTTDFRPELAKYIPSFRPNVGNKFPFSKAWCYFQSILNYFLRFLLLALIQISTHVTPATNIYKLKCKALLLRCRNTIVFRNVPRDLSLHGQLLDASADRRAWLRDCLLLKYNWKRWKFYFNKSVQVCCCTVVLAEDFHIKRELPA